VTGRALMMSSVSAAAVLVLAAPLLAQSGSAARAGQKPVWPDEGPPVWAPRPTETAITANDLRTHLYQLADDSMMGRRIGEEGNHAGTAYVAGVFERLGLKPAGDDGSFFQVMPFGPMAFDSAASTLRIAGETVVAGRDWIPVAPSAFNGLAGSADLADVPAVYAGRWGDVGTVLDPAVFGGRVAVFSGGPLPFFGRGGAFTPPEPPSCDSVPDRFGAEASILYEREHPRPTGGRGGVGAARDERARAAGVAAILFVNLDDAPGAADRAWEQRSGMRPEPDPTGTPGGSSITRATAERIFGRPLEALPVGTQGKAISGRWAYGWRLSDWPARNAVAVLPGAEPSKADEYVLISAHNDHVGVSGNAVDHDSLRAVNKVTRRQGANDPVCRPSATQQQRIDSLIARARSIRPPRRDSIMNGADDDGSGTVILLEVAERLAAERPGRSIIFVSHEGEEGGLLGSRWFTDHPTVPLDQVVAALNMDMESKGRADQVKYGGPTSIQILGARRLSWEFGGVIDSVNAVRTPVMAIDRSWDVPANPLNRFCRSDQVNYVVHDVPVAYFSTGYSEDYHQPTDEPQYADYDHMAKIGDFIHDIAMALAVRPDRPKILGPDPSYPQCR